MKQFFLERILPILSVAVIIYLAVRMLWIESELKDTKQLLLDV